MTLKSDKRKKRRFEYKTAIAIESMDGGISSVAKMFNVSEDGAYFESDALISTGNEILIWIANSPFASDPGVYESHRVQIAWRKDLSDSVYAYGYGVKHARPLDAFEESIVVSKYDRLKAKADVLKSRQDSRNHHRKPLNKSVYFSAQEQHYKGLVSNISQVGAFIETKDDFLTGQRIQIVVPDVRFDRCLVITAEIVRSDRTGVGLKFVHVKKEKTDE